MQSGLKQSPVNVSPTIYSASRRSPEELTLTELGRTRLVIVDLSGVLSQPQEVCEYYCFLMTQYKDIHWVYIIGRASDREAQIF